MLIANENGLNSVKSVKLLPNGQTKYWSQQISNGCKYVEDGHIAQ